MINKVNEKNEGEWFLFFFIINKVQSIKYYYYAYYKYLYMGKRKCNETVLVFGVNKYVYA